MKLRYILFILFVGANTLQGIAQINDNPIDILSEKLAQNELLSNRLLKNFVFIKTNTFKKKAMADMDKSIALFDDNLSYIILHLPYKNKVKEDFLKLQNFWNIYRINITDFDKDNYTALIEKTRRLNKYIKQLNKDVLDRHPEFSKNKKSIEMAQLALNNGKNADAIAAVYVLKNALNIEDADSYFKYDLGSMNKNLKKISKFKILNPKAKDLAIDLKTTLESITILLKKEKFNPKMMYAYDDSFTRKTFKLLKYIIQTINQKK